MKKPLKIVVVILASVAAVWLLASFLVVSVGKSMLAREIEKKLGVQAKVNTLRVVFPSSIVVEGLRIGETAKAEKIVLSPSVLGCLSGHIVLNSLVVEKPFLRVMLRADGTTDLGFALPQAQQGGEPPEFFVARLKVRDAALNFVDQGFEGQAPFSVTLGNWNADIARVSLLKPLRMQIEGAGEFFGAEGQHLGRVDIRGWADPFSRDMDADLAFSNITLAYFAPYARKFIGQDVVSGALSLSVDALSQRNDLKAKCHVEIADAVFADAKASDMPFASKNEAAAGIPLVFAPFMSAGGGKIVFDFTVNTKMDAPKFENVKISGSFFQPIVERALSKPPGETAEEFKKIGKEFEAIGKEFKKIFKSG